MPNSLDMAAFARKVDRVVKDLTDESLQKAVGLAGKRIGTDRIKADTGGDARMTNWRRGRPVNLATRYDLVGSNAVQVAPGARARGAVRVLNDGRQAGVSRRGRSYGASRGKGTWGEATQDMERELPKVAHEHVTKVLRKHF